MKIGRVKAKAAAPVPQTLEEVVEAIAAIGRHQRERARIEAAMGDELAVVRQRWEALAVPEGEAIKVLSAGVQAWCEAHRAELTDGGRVKTARLASGEVKWRLTPPSVSVKGVEAVLQLLRERGLGRFIREKLEVNKEAILAEPAAVAGIAGIRVAQDEEFVIAPFEVALGEAA